MIFLLEQIFIPMTSELLDWSNVTNWVFSALKSTSHSLPQSTVYHKSDSSSGTNSTFANLLSFGIREVALRFSMYSKKHGMIWKPLLIWYGCKTWFAARYFTSNNKAFWDLNWRWKLVPHNFKINLQIKNLNCGK